MNQLSRNLSIGQGGTGLGATRVHPNSVFIPRNAPPLVNLNLLDGRARGVQAVDPCFARSGICLQRHIPVSRFLRPDTPALRVLIRPLTSLHAAEQHRTHERARSSNSFQFTAIA